jgi:tetratricopeptide (TPR) repeat protein
VWPGAKRDQSRIEGGAGRLNDPGKGSERGSSGGGRPRPEPEWVREEEIRSEASDAARRGQRRPPRQGSTRPAERAPEHADGSDDLAAAVGSRRAVRAAKSLEDAKRAFRRDRYREAAKLLRPLAESAPRVAPVRELYGLSLYRLGRWREALRELEAFAALTQSTEQHPVIADCNRALRRWNEVDLRWTQLREASPSAALMAEGRIVVAGSLADRGRLAEAVGLLDRARWRVKHPRDHHLATAYALADLLERSGDVARARETFGWLVDVDPDFADAARRLAAVG